MERASFTIPEPVFQRAKTKAQQEDRTVDPLVSDLLDRWVAGEIHLPAPERSRVELVALARAARGMWADRDPDRYLAAGRAGLAERDVELSIQMGDDLAHQHDHFQQAGFTALMSPA